MFRALATPLGLVLGLAGCATAPSSTPAVAELCGTWAADRAREQWWLDGDGLRGEGRLDGDDEVRVTETLALRRGPDGHVYVATPGEAPATEFSPIDPATAKYPPAQLEGTITTFAWANYEHDFPQEIHYQLADDRLTATVSGPAGASSWEFTRVDPCESTPER